MLDRIHESRDGIDQLFGGVGDDLLKGGPGDDILAGGLGADRFAFTDANDGIDTITDFDQSEGDLIDLSAIFEDADLSGGLGGFVTLNEAGGDTFVQVDADGGGDTFIDLAILSDVTGIEGPKTSSSS